MRYRLAGLALAALLAGARGCDRKGIDPASQGNVGAGRDETPLLLEDGPLLPEHDPASGERDGKGADNSRCYVCHVNYVREDLAARHARADIGCARCHGESDAHIADESWASGGNGTAPDIMYPRARINPLCLGCHPAGKLKGEQHKVVLAGTGKEKCCTDCHGKHRLPRRRCKWR